MKLHLDNPTGEYRISGYSAGSIAVNGVHYEGALIVRVDEAPCAWEAAATSALGTQAVQALLPLAPEVLLIGTGVRQHFPDRDGLRLLYEAGFGFEIMDSAAACRTFNILAAEGRRVVAALLPL